MQAVFTQDASRAGKIHKRGRFGNVFALRDLWKRENTRDFFVLSCNLSTIVICSKHPKGKGANENTENAVRPSVSEFMKCEGG